jgi:hypothetical protein
MCSGQKESSRRVVRLASRHAPPTGPARLRLQVSLAHALDEPRGSCGFDEILVKVLYGTAAYRPISTKHLLQNHSESIENHSSNSRT